MDAIPSWDELLDQRATARMINATEKFWKRGAIAVVGRRSARSVHWFGIGAVMS